MRLTKIWTSAVILGGLAIVATASWQLSQKTTHADETPDVYVPPTLDDLSRWNGNDVRHHFESRGITLPPELPGVTLANGRYYPREEIYGNWFVNEVGLGRIVYRPSKQEPPSDTEE